MSPREVLQGPRVRWALRLLLLALLIIGWRLALTPGDGTPGMFPQSDKIQHLAAFAGFAWLVYAAALRPAWVWWAGLLAYGLAIEWAQSHTPGRQASLADALADAAGVALGAWVARRWSSWRGS